MFVELELFFGLLGQEVSKFGVHAITGLFFCGEVGRCLPLFDPIYESFNIFLMFGSHLLNLLIIIEFQLIQIKWPTYIDLNNIKPLFLTYFP